MGSHKAGKQYTGTWAGPGAGRERRVEVVEEKDTDNELVDDFVAVITSMAAGIYGQRNSRWRQARAKDKDGDKDGGKEGNEALEKDKKVGSQRGREDD